MPLQRLELRYRIVLRVVGPVSTDGLVEELLHDGNNIDVTSIVRHIPEESVIILEMLVTRDNLFKRAFLLFLTDRYPLGGSIPFVAFDTTELLSDGICADNVECLRPCSKIDALRDSQSC